MARWILGALLLLASPATAATLCVNPAGSGGCFASIQAAVEAAVSGDVVDVAAGTYVEDLSIPDVGRLTIRGAGPASTAIQAVDDFFTVTMGRGSVTISGVEVRGGERGIFVNDYGKLTLRDCAVTDHTSEAIMASLKTHLTIEDCVLSGNGGSALFATGATIHSRGTSVTIVRSEIGDNDGIAVHADRKLTIIDSTIRDNTRGGTAADTGSISGSTVSGNGALAGGGVSFGMSGFGGGTAKISNTTISDNLGIGLSISPGYGAQISHVTIASNTHDGLGAISGGLSASGARVTLRAAIIADNAPSDCFNTDSGASRPLRLTGASLIETPAACLTVGTSPITADPVLGPLQNNGGSTQTRALLPGSPAIGVLVARCSGVDQRGVARTRPCDLGAYETP